MHTYVAMTNLETKPPMSFLMIGEPLEGQDSPCFTIVSVDDAHAEYRDDIVQLYTDIIKETSHGHD